MVGDLYVKMTVLLSQMENESSDKKSPCFLKMTLLAGYREVIVALDCSVILSCTVRRIVVKKFKRQKIRDPQNCVKRDKRISWDEGKCIQKNLNVKCY